MLRVENLTKSYGPLVAVDHVSFEVLPGDIFGFLGPNGAGKTTTINMIASLIKPDSGSISIDGQELSMNDTSLRKKMGIVPQEVAVYEDLSAKENLKFWGGLYGLKGKTLRDSVNQMLQLTGLQDRAKEQVKKYSGGMKRRLNMAAGLLHKPKLLLLDEPTVGIDPQARQKMLDMVRDVAGNDTAILYTSHYLEEVEELCNKIAIIDHGRILAQGTCEELKKIIGENRLLTLNGQFSAETTQKLTEEIENLNLVSFSENQVVFSLPMDVGTGVFLEKLLAAGFDIQNLSIKEPSLNTVFLKLTGRELRD